MLHLNEADLAWSLDTVPDKTQKGVKTWMSEKSELKKKKNHK